MLIAVLAIFMLGTISNATTESELKDYLLSEKKIGGTTYIIRDTDKVKVENFFAKNEITDEQATKIKNVIDKAIAYMDKNGASTPEELKSKAQKQQLLAYAQEAASVLGLTVNYDTSAKRLDIYKEGKLVESLNWGVKIITSTTTNTVTNTTANSSTTVITTEPSMGKTGSTNYVYVIAGGLVLIAGTILVIARKKNISANV